MNRTKEEISMKVDLLLIERIPDYIYDELKWIRKDYGDDEISEFLRKDKYSSEFLNELNGLMVKYYSITNNN